MATEFGSLRAIRRGKELFYCFSEAKRNLFSAFADEYLNNVVRFLGIELLPCNAEESSFYLKFIPSQFGNRLSLISEQNLSRLHAALLNSSKRECARPNFGYKFPILENNSSIRLFPDTEYAPWRFQSMPGGGKAEGCVNAFAIDEACGNVGVKANGCETTFPSDKACGDIGPGSFSETEAVQTDGKDGVVPSEESLSGREVDTSSSTQGPSKPISEDEAASLSTATGNESKKNSLTLTDEEMSPKLRSDLSEIRKFYSIELNIDRDGGALQNTTIDKMRKGICKLLWFVKKVKNAEPDLSCCSDPKLVQEFVNYMMDTRGIKAITCSRYITAFLNAAKVPLTSLEKLEKEDLTSSLEKIRSVQRQLERIARKEHVDDLAKKPHLDKVVYPELLELCRELKWEVYEKSGQAQARSCMNLCLLLLYCSANPGRTKEYITLRIYQNQSEQECRGQNFIFFNEDGSVVLIEDCYKTRHVYGANQTDLTPLGFLTYYLQLYRTKLRRLLLVGKEHDFFFVNARGDPFIQKTYSNYISDLFEKYFSLKLTTVDIRKAVVNHFLSLPQSGDLTLRESFATLMKHSVRTQKRYYDERPLAEKKSKAIDLLSSMASRGLEDDGVEIIEDEDSELNIELLPLPGDFVALVASNSSDESPEIFLAKLLRLSEDKKTAFLAEFSEVEPGKFKLNAGKSYKEALNALVHPVDVVYMHSNGVYQLRTPKIDIHRQVYKEKNST